ncbi:Delta 2-isopentenyl pyrophosphate:tRNA isopentenyl transferase [Ogataea parapolymorpha DL-1]|uniref:tRNA dimethylallyltransferase n=1 Tax=Ogataea parapolymorpha (strain ATCC 26012 / BCRC 20466 / JCM 22074 / NRRL Y-7560 / DL-1) TaxID=871575 RepID=W1QBX8_OGAPD|nr:Delta 2-isopentenyl pyrophosphate:tRNA isopentenyl transferase [Ogataea parapolymorpha DL-1]ESW97843.1 Delta 2-isopentenyl pyrophosphate:tRNA isopentenyl transferase [Ogataea parapolymorpha DL-1]
MLRMSCKVISVIGTTGVGKSQFAVELARAVDGEIVNADSMQMYRGLDQITNKHPMAERKGVPHHVMDHTPWDTEYYIHRFKHEAMAAIADIHRRGKTAILVGGTHYYLQSLLFLNKTLDTATSEQLTDAERAVLDGPPDEVFRTLQQKDPVVAQKFHPNDHRRVRRALEIYFSTKQRTSDLYRSQQQQETSALRYQMLFFWLYARQDVLDERLDSRVDKMLQQGALDEIRAMHAFRAQMEPKMDLDRGVWQVIGYKEFLPYLEEGPERLAGCIEDMKRNTRRYARRQVKWISRTLTRELAREGQFGWPNGGQVVVLDATELGNWEQDVAQRGVDVCRRFLAGSPPVRALTVPETLEGVLAIPGEAGNDETKWQHHYCETCVDETGRPTLFVGEQYAIHLKSRRHRSNVKKSHRRLVHTK